MLPSETGISGLRWSEGNYSIGTSGLAVASSLSAMDECFSYHVQNLLPQDSGAGACLPRPASWTASKGLADGGTTSVLLCQLAGGAGMPAHLSLLMHTILLFLGFMLEYPNSG